MVHSLKIGFVVDLGFFHKAGGKVQAVLDEVETIVAFAGVPYLVQLNVRMEVDFVAFPTDKQVGFPMNQHPSTGCLHIQNSLQGLAVWSEASKVDVAHVHLLTDCYPAPGVIGIAYRNTLCTTKYNVAVSSYTKDWTWRTFMHEIGHSFGASHSFEEGVGKGVILFFSLYIQCII